MKLRILILNLLLITLCSFGQTTIYLEGFNGQTGKGATGSTPTIDLTGVDWNIDFSSASLSNSYRFRVRDFNGNQSFEGRNIGVSTWLSPLIDISAYTDIGFTIEASQGSNSLDNGDTVTTDYRIDGGSWINATTNGILSNDYGNATISTSALNGGTIEIRVIMTNNANNERQRIDNIEVTGVTLCPDITNLTIDSFTNDTATISWITGGSETAWEIVVQADGTGEPTGAGTTVVNTPSYTDNTLTEATAYEVYVRADCDTNGFSNWVGPVDFTTTIENDNFANATPISCDNIYSGDTSTATIDEIGAPDVATIETDTQADNDSPNVWYSFLGTGDVVTLSTCANTSFDSEILVFTGTSGNLTLIDDGYDECSPNSTYEAETTFTSVLGTQYFISVEGWNVGDTGTFELAISCFPSIIGNDDLANATPISCGNTYLGNTILATLDEDDAPDVATIEPDTQADNDSPNVWFSYIGTGDIVTLSTCANTSFDSEILVFTGTSGNLTLIDDGYDECNNITYEAETTFTSILNTQYLISVEGWNVGDTGTFELDITCVAPPPNTYTYNGTWSPSDPNGVATISDNIIIESNNAVINTNTFCNTVTVNPGANIIVNTGVTLTVVDATDGLILESTSLLYSGLILEDATSVISGAVNYQRFVNMVGSGATGNGGNDLVSLPLIPTTGLTFDAFLGIGNPSNATKIATNGTVYAFGPYDNTSNTTYVNYNVSATHNLIKGKGYRAATNSGQLLNFYGNIETNNVSIGITTPTNGAQWNLVGNPYPSYVNSSEFIIANSTVLDPSALAIYGYNSGTYSGTGDTINNFTIINNISNTDLNIAPGQGFFVAALDTPNFSDDIVFNSGANGTTDMRTTTGNNDFIESRNGNLNYNLKLDLVSTSTQTTSFYFNDNSSLGLDPGYDAAVYGDNISSYSIYSHLVEDNIGRAMAIQSLGSNNINNVTIPLGVNANQGEEITFSVSTSNLPDTIEIYLEDNITNTITLLKNGNYTVIPNTNLVGTGRFYLYFTNSNSILSKPQSTFDNLNIYTNKDTQTIIINGQLSENTMMKIYDIQGRIVNQAILSDSNQHQNINVSHLSAGVYIVKLKNTSQNRTEKVIIN